VILERIIFVSRGITVFARKHLFFAVQLQTIFQTFICGDT